MTGPFTDWTLVFDLDGTLVETAPDLHAALNHVLAGRGLGPVPIETIRTMIGDGAKALIRKGLTWHQQAIDESEIDTALWPAFMDHYLANIARHSHPYEDAVSALEQLSRMGARLAVCTNKAQTLAEAVLRALDLDTRFSAIVGGDALPECKPHGGHILETITRAGGRRDRAIMIGDSATDERAARHAQLPLVFVTFGYGNLSGEPIAPLEIIDHWRDMQAALLKIITRN